jgi:hypothetical protein
MVPALASLVLLSSCNKDKDDDITPPEDTTVITVDPDTGDTIIASIYDVELIMTTGDSNKDATVSVDPTTQTSVYALINFTDAESSMKRMYFTRNVGGAGAEPYQIDATVDFKVDGSIDIVSAKSDTLEYAINLPVPTGITEGSVVYTLWTTTKKGDPRDASINLAVGVGTITLEYGGTIATPIKEYSAKILAAPLADGSSETFFSLYDGNLYKIEDGSEYAALWDLGYYYAGTDNASLASASGYDSAFPYLKPKVATYSSELNNCFFSISSKTTAEFDAISTSAELDFILTSSSEKISNLVADNVIEFVDNYGKKGLIKVIEIVGTDGTGDYIKIDIKVQP